MGTDEYLDLSNLIKKSKPETVRQVVRDHWQRCIIGSDFHIGFIVSLSPDATRDVFAYLGMLTD